tara:strand:- start:74672 stop:76279 length:1608 start_codon:yes stop_codon:yes gene_type:complete
MDKVVLIIFFATFALHANVWNPAYYGQKDIDQYFGPYGGDFKSRVVWSDYINFDAHLSVAEDEYSGKTHFKFQSDKEIFFDLIQPDLYELLGEMDIVKKAMVCPHNEMSKNYSYYRYLFRLISISYLFESLKFHQQTLEKFDLSNSCNINFKELFQACKPKTVDMQFFLQNAEIVMDNLDRDSVSIDFNAQKFQRDWFSSFEKTPYTDISQTRLKVHCEQSNCEIKNKRDVQKNIKLVCEKDSELIKKICSEEDRLFGMTSTIHAYQAIKASDALMAVNENGNAQGCLRRFAIQNGDQEESIPVLRRLIPVTFEYMQNNFEARFQGGQLFPIGSLKLFRDQGLENLLVKQEKKEVEKKVTKVEKKVELPPLAPEPLKQFFKKKKKAKKVAKVKKVEKKKEVVKSQFLKAVEMRDQYSLEAVFVEMDKFKFDYVFTPKMTKILEEKLPKYIAVPGLEEMKKFDGLGDEKGVPLRFIKFLIDTNNHQGLYNLLQVLGDQFYVQNDIDNKKFVKAPTKISLLNDEYTNYQWQIQILKD